MNNCVHVANVKVPGRIKDCYCFRVDSAASLQYGETLQLDFLIGVLVDTWTSDSQCLEDKRRHDSHIRNLHTLAARPTSL